MKPEQEITKYFYDSTNMRCTGKIYTQQIGIAKSLLKANYTSEEIIQTIDYLIENPPKNGLTSLAYIQYAIEETLLKIKSRAIKSVMENHEEVIQITPQGETPNEDNKTKYQNSKKTKLKGMMGI